MKFLAGECPNRGLLLHPLYDPDAVLDVWARYVWLGMEPGTVWRIVECSNINRAAEIVRSTSSYPPGSLPDRAKELWVRKDNDDHNDRTDRGDGDGKQRPGRVSRRKLEPSGDPW